jgi:cytoplasmic iron level regulating protein YaaA (DUF328/UPF0246 family)
MAAVRGRRTGLVLIILPPSETKRPAPSSGTPLDLDDLSFPELIEMRQRVIEALRETSAGLDALRRLQVGPRLADEVARNADLRALPTRRAVDTYAGPLYEGLDARAWSPDAERRAAGAVIIVSALWGAIRPADRIPPYRLNICARLVGMERLEPMWRSSVSAVFADAAGAHGPILDLRSPVYRTMGRAPGLERQTVTLRIRPSPGGPAHIGDVIAKRVRGAAASHLLDSGLEPEDPLDIADMLAPRWSVEVDPPSAGLREWRITLLGSA